MLYHNFENTKKLYAFTLAEGATHVAHSDNIRRAAFTLAEVLITLGIIGVVAAMTMPVLIHKYQMRALETQFKKAYSVIQNVNLMMKANDIDPWESYQAGLASYPDTIRDEASAIKQVEDFVRFTKGSHICDGHYYECTYGERRIDQSQYYKTLDGKNNAHIDADAYLKKIIQLADGSTVWVGGLNYFSDRYYYDINGTGKGPNRLGYDLHVFTINKNGSIQPYVDNGNINKCSFIEAAHGSDYLGFGCTYYAVANINPDGTGGTYWNGFLK